MKPSRPLHILFYTPLKPLGHANPSGDLTIAGDLIRFLQNRGHTVHSASSFRSRWFYWKPQTWPECIKEKRKLSRLTPARRPDVWLTYHSYYKAPDVMGPPVCRGSGIPYAIFEASYATKFRRRIKTAPGFLLNRAALKAADHIFANRREDYINLKRIIPDGKTSLIPPGIRPEDFRFDPEARKKWRETWRVGHSPVVATAAMFRPGVKTRGLEWTIRACGDLVESGMDLHLAVAGDGDKRDYLVKLAEKHLRNRVHFTGLLPRERLAGFYSSADVFAFPGFDESLGMVYLEAQSTGRPVAAMADGGVPEVVRHGKTGLLSDPGDFNAFRENIRVLLTDSDTSEEMGRAAAESIKRSFDLETNYGRVEQRLMSLAGMGI